MRCAALRLAGEMGSRELAWDVVRNMEDDARNDRVANWASAKTALEHIFETQIAHDPPFRHGQTGKAVRSARIRLAKRWEQAARAALATTAPSTPIETPERQE